MEWVALAVAAAAAYLAFMRPSQSCVDGIGRDAMFAAGGVRSLDSKVAKALKDITALMAGALDGINRLGGLEDRVEKLENRPDHLKHEMASINRRVVALEKKDAKLEGRDRDLLAASEKLRRAIHEDIDGFKRKLEAEVAKRADTNTKMNGRITGISNATRGMEERLDSLEELPTRVNERLLDTLEALDEESALGKALHEILSRIKSEAMSRGREVKALHRRIARLEKEWGE